MLAEIARPLEKRRGGQENWVGESETDATTERGQEADEETEIAVDQREIVQPRHRVVIQPVHRILVVRQGRIPQHDVEVVPADEELAHLERGQREMIAPDDHLRRLHAIKRHHGDVVRAPSHVTNMREESALDAVESREAR